VSDLAHTITVNVDASRAKAGLEELRRSVGGVGQELRGLGSQNSAFSNLASQVQSASSSFGGLARSMSAVSSASRSIGALSGNGLQSLSRGAGEAHRAVAALASAINPLHASIAALSTLVGGLSLSHFSKAILETGNNVLSFKLALDSVATDSGEANRMFEYIAGASNRLGVSLESNLETFKNLRVSMASLGIDTARTQTLFENFGKAFAALHTSAANVKRGYYDISEVFSLGKLDATRARAVATHIPGFIGALQEALHGKELHAAFREGIPAQTIEEVAKILGRQYQRAQEKALEHSQANLNILGNKFALFKSDVFDKGFDSGLTSFLKEMNSALDGAGFKTFGATVGEGFRQAFAGATLLGKAIIDMREPLAEVVKTLGTFALAVVGIGAVGAAFTLLTSPLGALAALATLVIVQWDNLAATFRKAALGAVESYALIQGLISGKGWEESKHLAAVAGGEYLQKHAGAQAGEGYAEAFLARVKSVFDSMPGMNLDKYTAEWNRLMKESTPKAFQGVSDYTTNAARQDEILLRQAEHAAELTNKLKTLREQLLPTAASFDKLRETLEKIESMRGKKIGGHAIADSELDRMAAAAKETAFQSAYPAASRIRDLTDNLRIEQQALEASGGNASLMREEKAYLQERLALKRRGVELTNEESAALRVLIHAQESLSKKDGFSSWAESQKTGMDSINQSIGHGLDTVADGLAKIATEGKNIKQTFRDMLRSVASDLIRSGLRSMMAEGIKGLNLSSVFGNGDIAKALGMGDSIVAKAKGAVDDAAKSIASAVTPSMSVEAGVVYLNGATVGSGLDSFRPGTSINDAIRPQGAGGVLARNDNGAPLFSGNALPQFGANARTGGLGSIPSNSAALFGSSLTARKGLGDVGDALKPIGDLKLSGPESVKAFGQNLQKLAPVAERAGLSPISDSLAAMYAKSGLNASTIKNLQTIHPDLARVFLRAKEISGQTFTMNNGQGLRTQAQANENAAKGLGIKNSRHLTGEAGDVNLMRNGRYIADGHDPAYRSFNDSMQQAAREQGVPITWGGTFRRYDADHWELQKGWQGLHKSNGGIGGKSADLGKQLNDQTAKTTQEIQKQLTAQRALSTESEKSFKALAQTTQPLQSFDGGVTKLSESMSQGIPATESFTGEIEKLLSKLLSGLGGGGGGLGGVGELLGGLFSEGGYSGSPVSSASMPASFWAGAPAFAEGTANTSGGGGMPAILHPNEAVIPLSRGRKIPVEINGGNGGAGQTIINNHVTTNVQGVNDFHSFRRSHGQLMSGMQREAARLAARNN
jgi:LAS superfamily LD-carboxypeptidase LdcB